MNKVYLRLMLVISLFIASLAQAANIPKDSYVTDWSENLLMNTLSVSYLDTDDESAEVQKNYSAAAWEPMSDFFHKEIKMIKEQSITLHPKALTEPTITRVAQCISNQCWRVNQSFQLPELHMSIDFSLLIVNAKPAEDVPILVQSVDMKVHHY